MRHALDRTLGVLAVLLCGAAHASVFDGTWRADMSTARLLAAGPPQVIRVQDGQYACRTCDPPLAVRADGTDQPASGARAFDTVSIAVLDEYGNQLYQGYFTDRTFNRKFKLADPEITSKLTFVIRNFGDNSVQRFQVDATSQLVEDVEVTEVR